MPRLWPSGCVRRHAVLCVGHALLSNHDGATKNDAHKRAMSLPNPDLGLGLVAPGTVRRWKCTAGLLRAISRFQGRTVSDASWRRVQWYPPEATQPKGAVLSVLAGRRHCSSAIHLSAVASARGSFCVIIVSRRSDRFRLATIPMTIRPRGAVQWMSPGPDSRALCTSVRPWLYGETAVARWRFSRPPTLLCD